MISLFLVRKYAGLLLSCFLPTMAFAIGSVFYSFWVGLICFGVAVIVALIATSVILRNPFTQMLEGKGLLTFNIDSTGVIRPFLMAVQQPFVKAKGRDGLIEDVYDRSSVLQLDEPVKAGKVVIDKDEKGEEIINITLNKGEFNHRRFGLYQFPVLIYNGQMKSLVTKEFLSEEEKRAFAEHGILYLNRKMEELTSLMRDFGRYVVELTKPKASLLKNKWVWLGLVALIIILAILFGKPLFEQLFTVGSKVTGGLGSTSPVVPR